MGTKNISISDEAYSRLAAQKGQNESFTDVINRLTGKRSVLELVGLLTEEQAKDVHSEIRKVRKRSKTRLEQIDFSGGKKKKKENLIVSRHHLPH
jgi:predicted CopG family antitoxin